MTLLRLSPTALARCRFALSPLAETLGSLIALHRPAPEPWLKSWHTANQPGFQKWLAGDPFAAGLLALVSATKWLPDMVAVPPTGGTRTRLRDELKEVATFTDDEIRATVATAVTKSWEPQDTRWLSGADLGPRTAEVLAEGWRRHVAKDWPRRRALLERDIMHRAGLLAAYGWKEAVKNMTRHSVWVGDDAIRFSEQDYPDRWITDEGLVFVPKTAGVGSWTCERPPLYALVYPARGPAAEVAGPAGDPLGSLLGPGRARVVRELRRAATSTQLAYTLDVSLGTVSTHLAVLRDAGVVAGARVGRAVVYRLTERGTDLLSTLDT
ncbi:Helix-turn-helix domain-containing protein [Asanoa hainanensis]|uniref:Helix-turn-helix domain-containing protein n=1 Tax=Asanoa hainanensis TaxID=560556 RepID=A0A239NCW6_9ACTN|nr:winged helix-turn-helix domain-containing protein [Asanoa hainanensis]SNT52741.1 Helix-turn-helix domain-containing protein [Asanoa hainanensis]